jgi:hypothetical protein
MNLLAPISEAPAPQISTHEIEVRPSRARRSSAPVPRAAWFEISQRDLSLWNNLLLPTNTWLYQYPFWNEPYRPLWLTPRYLAWGTQDQPLAFVCILTVGIRPAKIGLVFRGPTSLQSGSTIPEAALLDLLDWTRSEGYMFVRFTHSDAEILSQIAELAHAETSDAFPYFLDYPVLSPDYVVEQYITEGETLASFDREARRKIRRAIETGYEFRSDDSPQALAQMWPLYEDCSQRKHFRLERPLSVYMEMMRLARPHHCARVYSVWLDSKVVGTTLVVRDGNSAHCVLAAFDAAHRQSAAFLHWMSMRDMYYLGAQRYNLGPGPGSLARFKQQFARHPVAYPGPLTVVLKENWFRAWKSVFPVAKALRPMLRSIVSRMRR